MALNDIKYGSLASSEILNDNFRYLDNKIENSSELTMTSISSILSNIATINTRLNEVTDLIESSITTINSTIDNYKAKTKLLVSKASMLPNWSACFVITIPTGGYTCTQNGYLLVIAHNNSAGEININGVNVKFKTIANAYDNASQMATIPVKANDIVTINLQYDYAYFLPTTTVDIENF